MAPTTNRNNKRQSSQESKTNQRAKKAKIPIDSSEDELEASDSPIVNAEDEVSSSDGSIDISDDNDGSNSSDYEKLDDEEIDSDSENAEAEESTKKDNEQDASSNHNEQRKLLKERKMKRKSGTQIQQIKSLWERLRVKNPPMPKQLRDKLCDEVWELSKDLIKDLVMKHDASRIVQTLVKYSTKDRREQITRQLKGNFYVLATSSYGKYLLVKLLHYGSKDSIQLIIDELHGKLRKLLRHREGAYVVEDLFVLYATNEQKQQMIREFWGSEYAVFRDTHKGLTIEDACATSVEKRNIIARNLIGTITASVDKGSTGFQILHVTMKEYVKIADAKEISEMIEMLHEQFAELVHTPEGCEVACTLIAKANAKERRSLLKSLKAHAESLIKNEHGHMVLVTILMTVDDTVMVHKTFGPAVKEHCAEFIIDKFARRPWIYLLVGLDGKYFSPIAKDFYTKYELLSKDTSKKDQLVRRTELLGKFAPNFLSSIKEAIANILKENLGCQFTSEILTNDLLYEQLSESDKKIFEEVVDLVLHYYKGSPSDADHPIHAAYAGRLLKTMIQGGKWNNKEKKLEPLKHINALGPSLALKLFANIQEEGHLLNWINDKDSSFTIVALYETLRDTPEGKTVTKAINKLIGSIEHKDTENKGSKLLLKLIDQ